MKRIPLISVSLAVGGLAAYWAGYGIYPEDFARCEEAVGRAFGRAGEGVAANPAPVALALGTFLLTVIYHTLRGKTLRESVEVAATRVTVVPLAPPAETEAVVLRRAKARATRTQLVADQIGLENRHRALPASLLKAEQEACYTEKALAEAEQVLADRKSAHAAAEARLAALRREKQAADAELTAIAAELKKLAEVV